MEERFQKQHKELQEQERKLGLLKKIEERH